MRELHDAAPEQPEYRTELARTYHDEGLLYRKKGLLKDAEKAFRGAMDQRAALVKEFPEEPLYLRDQSQSTYWLGTTLARMKGKQKEAEEKYRAAIAMQGKLLAIKNDQPEAADLRRDYERDQARMLNNLGLLFGLTGANKNRLKLSRRPKESRVHWLPRTTTFQRFAVNLLAR